MSEKLGRMATLTPMFASAQAACSRLEPQPKLVPAIKIGLPELSGSSTTVGPAVRSVARRQRPRPARLIVLSHSDEMITSVSQSRTPNG